MAKSKEHFPGEPYVVTVTIEGVADFLFHKWSNEAVAKKAKAAKGSDEKKSDDVESFVYRNDSGELCIPGEYIRQSIIGAAKYKPDPRSPRKSAMDIFKAGIVSLTKFCPLGKNEWDYVDARRVVVQKNAITRHRPAMKEGWKISCDIMINLPEYITEELLREVLASAGKLVGIGDFRPTFGRFKLLD